MWLAAGTRRLSGTHWRGDPGSHNLGGPASRLAWGEGRAVIDHATLPCALEPRHAHPVCLPPCKTNGAGGFWVPWSVLASLLCTNLFHTPPPAKTPTRRTKTHDTNETPEADHNEGRASRVPPNPSRLCCLLAVFVASQRLAVRRGTRGVTYVSCGSTAPGGSRSGKCFNKFKWPLSPLVHRRHRGAQAERGWWTVACYSGLPEPRTPSRSQALAVAVGEQWQWQWERERGPPGAEGSSIIDLRG